MANETPLWFRAEKQVLSAIFSGGDVFSVTGIISPTDFYCDNTRSVFEAMILIADRGGAVDPITVMNEIQAAGKKTEATSAGFIAEIITGESNTASTAEVYAQMVKGFSTKRKLISALRLATAQAESEKGDTQEIIGQIEKELSELSLHNSRDIVKIGAGYEDFSKRIDAIGNGSGIVGLTTGFKDLDSATSGFVNGEFTVIAARPGMGKTALVMESLWSIGKANVPSLLVSLEMSGNQIYSRLACCKGEVDLLRFRSGKLFDSDYPKLMWAAGEIEAAPIYLADTAISGCDEMSIRGIIRKAVKKYGVKIVGIDYLQLMTMKGHRGNREGEVASISRGLKQLSRNLDIPIVALCQLSRKCEEGPDKRPTLSSLRESGAIEQDADVVIGLYRDEYYKKDSRDKGIAEAIILKQRNGPTFTVKLQFTGAYARFGNLDQSRQEYQERTQPVEREEW